jgi:PST family polysaccharide transporter
MGADFYPRLTAAIDNRPAAIRLVNEQIEIGVLLALPGLLATIALAPIAMKVLYTEEFLPAAALLPWFIIGVFCRVISWPLGFVQHAKGAARWFFWTQTAFAALHLLLILYFFSLFGLVGVAYAFAAAYGIHAPAMLWVASRLIGFRWSREVRRLLAFSAVAVAAGVLVSLLVEGWQASVIGTAMAVIGGVGSLSGLAARLGPEHRLIRPFLRIPGMARVLRTRSP